MLLGARVLRSGRGGSRGVVAPFRAPAGMAHPREFTVTLDRRPDGETWLPRLRVGRPVAGPGRSAREHLEIAAEEIVQHVLDGGPARRPGRACMLELGP